MRVLVTGGRDYSDAKKVYEVLDEINSETPIRLVIQGGASGADNLAKAWCESRNIPCLNHPADWGKHGKVAGPIRNKDMLYWRPQLVVAFPGGRGTQNMVNVAEQADLDVRVVK